jgi:(S)-ureidoglycine aminohydrolase
MSAPYGHTRTRIAPRHALLAPDGHVKSSVPGITGAATIILISEAMGAKFAQMLVTFAKGGRATFRQANLETFGYVMSGEATLMLAGNRERCTAGGFFYAAAGQVCELSAPKAGTQMTIFQKRFVALPGAAAPHSLVGSATKIKGQPFLGDPDAQLQVLLPDEPTFDLAINIFTYQPGATLPFVETHVMEHGLIMLAGQGVYRLEDSWYPVAAGDVIWMAPYCPQWFVAIGKTPASYLYYKEVNRAAL